MPDRDPLHLVQVLVRELHRLFGELQLVVLPKRVGEDLAVELNLEVRRDPAPEVVTVAPRNQIAQTHLRFAQYPRATTLTRPSSCRCRRNAPRDRGHWRSEPKCNNIAAPPLAARAPSRECPGAVECWRGRNVGSYEHCGRARDRNDHRGPLVGGGCVPKASCGGNQITAPPATRQLERSPVIETRDLAVERDHAVPKVRRAGPS